VKQKIFFLLKGLLLVVLIILFCFVIVMPQYTQNYQASLVDKVNRLKAVEEPKIILVGNSNLVFGMDSPLLEKETGLKVVNMGLHGGVGNVFNEQAALINLNPGDYVIVCHSNYADDDTIKNPELAWVTIENHLELYSFIRRKDVWDMAKAYPTYLHKSVTMWADHTGNGEGSDPIFRRSSFNEWGDNIYPREQSVEGLDLSMVAVSQISDQTVKRLNQLNKTVVQQGATLLIAAYPIAYHDKAPAVEEYQAFQKALETKIDAPVISNYTEYCLDPKYFYNTYLHLTTQGARVRTQLLSGDFQKYRNEHGGIK